MNSPTHEKVAERARQIWQNYGSPTGRDTEIWLEAERQLMAGTPDSGSNVTSSETVRTASESRGATAFAERIRTGSVTDHSMAGQPLPTPISIPAEETAKAAQQKKEARAPRTPPKKAPKPTPPESGKPLWDKPHST